MIMTDRYVWHPQKSIANDESEDGGRGSLVLHAEQQDVDPQLKKKRKKAIIQRRKTPTVDVRVLLSQASARTKSNRSKEKLKARDTYETIETQEGPGPSILECSSIVYRMKPQTSTTFPENELCGWRDRELESYKPAANRSMTFSSFDRSRLQTPATGLRSNLQSRARSTPHPSSRGKRREPYVFQHFSETHHYIEHYRIFHSYTTLTVPGLKNKLCTCTDKAIAGEEFLQGEPPPEPKVVEQDSDGIVQPEVKSYSHEDPYAYLRELVSRLGVQTLAESTPKPTPPSITKKTKHNEDLVVCSNRDMYAILSI